MDPVQGLWQGPNIVSIKSPMSILDMAGSANGTRLGLGILKDDVGKPMKAPTRARTVLGGPWAVTSGVVNRTPIVIITVEVLVTLRTGQDPGDDISECTFSLYKYVYIYICVYMYIYTYIHIHTHTDAHVCARLYLYMLCI